MNLDLKSDFPRPSPRSLSEAFMKGSDGHGSVRNRTTMLAFFGQVSRDSYLLLSATKHYDRQHSTATDDLHRKCSRAADLLHTQVVTSEILMASEMQSCPIEVTKIPISK